jgi:hypothetical protein
MKLSKKERDFLTTLGAVVQKILHSSKSNGSNGSKLRKRRSSADVVLLRKQIRLARRRNVPVKQIAEELGVTTSYIYQMANK